MPPALSIPITFDHPAWLWFLPAVPILAVVSMKALRGLESRRRLVAIGLRCLVTTFLIVALARVQFVQRNDHVAVMFVLDRSKSVPEELRLKAQEYIRETVKSARNVDHDARFGVIGFDGQADVDVVPSRVGATVVQFASAVEPDRTNIASALRLALAGFPPGYARRLVLITDGNENDGSLLPEVESLAANGVAVDIVPLRFDRNNEVLIERMIVPGRIDQETRLPIRIVLKSTRATRARLTLFHNDREVRLPEEDRILKLAGGMRPEPFELTLEPGGAAESRTHHFEARITPLDEGTDVIAENNQASAFSFTEQPTGVLLLRMPDSPDETALADALRRAGVKVTELRLDESRDGVALDDLMDYDTVILSNIPADEFNEVQHRNLADYVHEVGGSLIVIGGDKSFGAGGWRGTPLEEISPVSFSIPNREVLPSAALMLVLDHSGSMASRVEHSTRTQQQIANEAAILAARSLLPQDLIGVIGFDTDADWVVPPEPCRDLRSIEARIRSIGPGGGTNMYPALLAAYEQMAGLKGQVSVKHIILLTDGQSEPGPYEELGARLAAARITLSTIGVGDGMNDPVLRRLAELGSGVYHPVRNPTILPRLFFRETRILRDRLTVNETFTPQLVRIGSPFLEAGSFDLPALGGYVRTIPKPDRVLSIVRKTDKGEDPILAYWNSGAGKMAVFTSGLWNHDWGSRWAAWDSFADFWGQFVRWFAGQTEPAAFDVVTRMEGSKGRISFEALQQGSSYLTNLFIERAVVLSPDGQHQSVFVTQTGPGQYQADFDVARKGSYLGVVNYRYFDAQTGESRRGRLLTGLSVAYSPEYRELSTNRPVLDAIAQHSTGRVLAMNPRTDDVFNKNLPPSVSRQPAWRWVVQWLLLPLFLLDVAGRRLASSLVLSLYVEMALLVMLSAALFSTRSPPWSYALALVAAESVGWSIRWRYILPSIEYLASAGLSRRAAEAGAGRALGQLKTVRERLLDDMRRSKRRQARTTSPGDASPDPRARFEVSDARAAEPAGDLTEAVGGATGEEAATGGESSSHQTTDNSDRTARLLRAKKRAQEGMDSAPKKRQDP